MNFCERQQIVRFFLAFKICKDERSRGLIIKIDKKRKIKTHILLNSNKELDMFYSNLYYFRISFENAKNSTLKTDFAFQHRNY